MDYLKAFELVNSKFPFEGYMNTEKGVYFDIAKIARRNLKPGSKILDFGCGPCDKTSILQFMGYNCTGCDDLKDHWHNLSGNKEKILSFAKDCGIDFRLIAGGTLPFKKEIFDMVMLHDVLEHLHDSPRNLLNDLLTLVKPGGLLFITVPSAVNIRKRIAVSLGKTNLPRFEGYYWYPGSWRGHVREYVKDDLIKLSSYLDLQTIELRSCNYMLDKIPSHIKPIAKPAYLFLTKIFKGWRDSWLLVAKKKDGWLPKKTLKGEELHRILEKATSYKYD